MDGAPRAKIVLLTGHALWHNPRVIKEASALERSGYDVQVLGAWLDPAFKARDLALLEDLPFRFVPAVDATLPAERARHFVRRAGRKIAHLVHGATGWQSPWQLEIGIDTLFRDALRIPADLYVAHSEAGLHAADRLARVGRRIAVDMEDWFSEDMPDATDRPWDLLRRLERAALGAAAYASCPSHAMSAALARQYGCASPAVVYNAFAWSERARLDGTHEDRRDRQVPSIHWYSTTLGSGRGLDDLMQALPLLRHRADVHLRGRPAPGFETWIKARIPAEWRERVFFHDLVTNDRLLARIAEHDIGFAGETKTCRNRDLTISNKILHYLLAGLAVVASDTAGQREVAAQAGEAVLIYPGGDPAALARRLDDLLGSPDRLRRARAAALAAAEAIFCWERQEGVLLDAAARALSAPARQAIR